MGLKSYLSALGRIVEPTFDNITKITNQFIIATGGTISTPGDGYTYHTFTTPGSFTIVSGLGNVEMVAIGAGGGGGGFDPPFAAGGGGGGGVSLGKFSLSPTILSVSVGGGGGGGSGNVVNTGGGTAGTNGGGTGGNAGNTGYSGGGGGGGGWSGISTGSTYYVVGGGAAGGGGSNEGNANNTAAGGGGSPRNVYRTDSLTGVSGLNFPGDGGGWGGSGGGYDGASGGGGGPSNEQNYGGSNYVNPIGLSTSVYAGADGDVTPSNTAGSRAPTFLPTNPSWTPVVPATVGNGGAGGSASPVNGALGQNGIVIIRYLS